LQNISQTEKNSAMTPVPSNATENDNLPLPTNVPPLKEDAVVVLSWKSDTAHIPENCPVVPCDNDNVVPCDNDNVQPKNDLQVGLVYLLWRNRLSYIGPAAFFRRRM
jgi:hypothetical protein